MVGVWRVDHSDSNASQRRNDHIIPAWCVDAKATKGNSYALTKFRLMRASKEVRVCWLGRVYVAGAMAPLQRRQHSSQQRLRLRPLQGESICIATCNERPSCRGWRERSGQGTKLRGSMLIITCGVEVKVGQHKPAGLLVMAFSHGKVPSKRMLWLGDGARVRPLPPRYSRDPRQTHNADPPQSQPRAVVHEGESWCSTVLADTKTPSERCRNLPCRTRHSLLDAEHMKALNSVQLTVRAKKPAQPTAVEDIVRRNDQLHDGAARITQMDCYPYIMWHS